MKKLTGFLGILFGILGLSVGVTEWVLNTHYLPLVDHSGPASKLADYCWLGQVVFYGVAIICISMGHFFSDGKD